MLIIFSVLLAATHFSSVAAADQDILECTVVKTAYAYPLEHNPKPIAGSKLQVDLNHLSEATALLFQEDGKTSPYLLEGRMNRFSDTRFAYEYQGQSKDDCGLITYTQEARFSFRPLASTDLRIGVLKQSKSKTDGCLERNYQYSDRIEFICGSP